MATVIHTTASREQLRAAVAELPRLLAGRVPDRNGIAHGFRMRVAFAFFSAIKLAFIEKSHGGTDAAGIKWAPLSKKYLAYGRRFGRGEQTALKAAAGLGKGHRYAPGDNKGLLTKDQLKRWRSIYARNLVWLAARESIESAKAAAASIAWATLKREGAKTKLDVFGNRQVDILRDTSTLLRSLSPGTLSESGPVANYTATDGQVVRTGQAELIVGTNVPYAAANHRRRPFWPERELPQVWLDDINRQAARGLVEAAGLLARGFAA